MSRPAAEMSSLSIMKSLTSSDSSTTERVSIQPSVPQNTPPSSPPIPIRGNHFAHSASVPHTNCRGSAFESRVHISEEEWQRRLQEKEAQKALKQQQVLTPIQPTTATTKGQSSQEIKRTVGF